MHYNAGSMFLYFVMIESSEGPVLRSRLVWDPAHISMLESWYNNETRYPSISQSQSYANTLSLTPPTGNVAKISLPFNNLYDRNDFCLVGGGPSWTN